MLLLISRDLSSFSAARLQQHWYANPSKEVRRVLRNLPDLLNDDNFACNDEVNQLLKVAEHYRHGHIRNAEHELSKVTNSFLRTGIQFVLDRSPLDENY